MGYYHVEVPVLVKVMIGVKADSLEEAKDIVFEEGVIHLDVKDLYDKYEYIDHEWEMHERLVRGNVFYGDINSVDVREDEDYDEDEIIWS